LDIGNAGIQLKRGFKCVLGIPELMVDGETGLVVPSRNPVTLSAALVKLAVNPELRERAGRSGRTRVKTAPST